MGKNSRRQRHTRTERQGLGRGLGMKLETAMGVPMPAGHVCTTDEFTFDSSIINWVLTAKIDLPALVARADGSTPRLVATLNTLAPPEPLVLRCRCGDGLPPLIVYTSGPDLYLGQ